jgi:hypothetical protein
MTERELLKAMISHIIRARLIPAIDKAAAAAADALGDEIEARVCDRVADLGAQLEQQEK